jgi:epoxyqueuosine reductase QueG
VEEDRWTDALREHLTACDDCVAAMAVAPWMERFAKMSDREHILPDPSVVWLKAKLLQNTAEANRVSRPLDVAQFLAYLVVAGGWAGLLTWRWDALMAWMNSLTPAGIVQTAASRTPSLSLSLVAAVLMLASITVMLALHTILAEE